MVFMGLSILFLVTFFSYVAVDLRHAKQQKEKERENG